MTWPKRITTYIGSDKETMYGEGEDIGLSGEALSLFRHALMEVEVVIDVNEDGTYTIVSLKE